MCIIFYTFFYVYNIRLQSKPIKILKKKKNKNKAQTKLWYLKEKKRKTKRTTHGLNKPKTLFMNLLVRVLIQVSMSDSCRVEVGVFD